MIYPSVEYINQTRIDRAKLSFGDAAFKSLWLQIKLQRGFHSRLNGFQVRKKGILGERFAYSLDLYPQSSMLEVPSGILLLSVVYDNEC